jgi:hypothetical protein
MGLLYHYLLHTETEINYNPGEEMAQLTLKERFFILNKGEGKYEK